MIAQRNPGAKILAIDISEAAAELGQSNFEESVYAERLSLHHVDYKSFKYENVFDLIVCNPPFFEPNDSQKDTIATQTLELDAETFLCKSAGFLAENGRISVIIPADQAGLYQKAGRAYNLFPVRKIDIYGIQDGEMKRNILEFSKNRQDLTVETFVIEKSPRKYSDQYLELTKEFHVFGK